LSPATGVALPVNFQSDIADALAKGSHPAIDDLPAHANNPNTVSFASRLPASRRFARRL
jgi:hypothetical protein